MYILLAPSISGDHGQVTPWMLLRLVGPGTAATGVTVESDVRAARSATSRTSEGYLGWD